MLKNLKEQTAADKARDKDMLKLATKALKAKGFRVVKKPRYNQFLIIDLKIGTIYQGRGYSLTLDDLIRSSKSCNSWGYGLSLKHGEIRKVDKKLEDRAKALNLSVICYPYCVLVNKYLYDAYIIFDKKKGELIGEEGWKVWNRASVEDYLDKLESGEIVR